MPGYNRSMRKLQQLGLYWRTLRHLRLRQGYWRARYLLQRRLGSRQAPHPYSQPPWDPAAADRLRDFALRLARHLPQEEQRLAQLRNGVFTYVNRSVSTEGCPPWHETDQPRLWQYHAHYGEELLDLALAYLRAPLDADRERAAAWMEAWIDRHPLPAGIAWEAYPIAARLMNWAIAAAAFDFSGDTIRRSILQQARFLDRYPEYDIQANHLLKDAAALVCAGALVDATLLDRGLRLLQQQVSEQVLEDGGHYERSPMYHAQALFDCLVAYAVLPEKPGWLAEALSRMTAVLEGMRLGDGEIPFFNDTVLGQAMPAPHLLALARDLCRLPVPPAQSAITAYPQSGFYILGPADQSSRMIVKAGPPGPAHQLGHAHCDALSYELSIGAQRVFVNSGVHDYEDSDWRRYARSTRAHNTLQIENREQLEAWSIFRTGRRYRCRVQAWERQGASQVLCASHDGFAPFMHERTIRYHAEGGFWAVIDCVRGPSPFAAASFIHCHPACSVELEGDNALVTWPGGKLHLLALGVDRIRQVSGQAAPHQGWYAPQFYTVLPAPTLILSKHVSVQATFGYVIVPEHSRLPSMTLLQTLLRPESSSESISI